jgi:hypothetical protein
MRRKVPLDAVFMPEGSKQKQIGQLACCKPGKAASLLRAPECKTPVAVDPVPAHIGDFNAFAGHGFHRVSEDCFYLSNLDRHENLPNVIIALTDQSAYHRPVARSKATPTPVRRDGEEARTVYIR